MKPMLARLVRELPDEDGYQFEPKWDGFRCLATRSGDEIELESRHGRPLGRYFPELLAALSALDSDPWTIDGEILLAVDGRFDFQALMGRLHPAKSRVRELAGRLPASFVAFDLPFVGGESLSHLGFGERRRRRGQASRLALQARRPGDAEGQARAHRRLRGRWRASGSGGRSRR